jgi:hypothetical protein
MFNIVKHASVVLTSSLLMSAIWDRGLFAIVALHEATPNPVGGLGVAH